MKKTILPLCALLLLAACAMGAPSGEAPPPPPAETVEIPAPREDAAATESTGPASDAGETEGGWWTLFGSDWDLEGLPPAPEDSIAVTHEWPDGECFQAYYPRLSDAPPYPGLAEIRRYYEEQAVDAAAYVAAYAAEREDDAAFRYSYYWYGTYSAVWSESFLSVCFFTRFYGGGAHSLESITVDNFDLNTGKLLTLADVFGAEEGYYGPLNRAICAQLAAAFPNGIDFPFAEDVDILSYANHLQFHLTADGVTFFFQAYEIGPYSAGIIDVIVPYASLASILNPLLFPQTT